jgi:perosamine synthetase
MIPLSEPDIDEDDIAEVVAVLRGTRLSLGPKMEEFEAAVRGYVGQPFGIAVSSGTAGLHLCVRALGIGPGDEVIVPSFTFIAAANAVRYEGATPVFVDIDAVTLDLDPARVEEAITARTRAIMVVHTFGVAAEMGAILAIAERHGLRVIEDACEAIGAEFQGKRVGAFGDAAVFAFYPNKQITTGEGGMVVTRDAELAEKIRAMRNQGRFPSDDWHQHSVLGYNYRLSEIHCALGCAQMRRIDAILARREAVTRMYDEALGAIAEIERPAVEMQGRRISWFVYVVRLAARFTGEDRDEVAAMLIANGVACGRYFAPVHTQRCYGGVSAHGSLPVTEAVSERTLALPFFNRLDKRQIVRVAEVLDQAVDD